MSTRGCYRFIDGDNQGPYTVYKHSDNYPWGQYGGVAAIAAALPYAWPLPRFEADEFAAGFVSANKKCAEDMAREYDQRATEYEKADPDTVEWGPERGKKAIAKAVASYRRQAAEYRDPNSSYAKMCGGNVRLMNTPDANSLDYLPGDIEYLYDVSFRHSDLNGNGNLWIKVHETSGGWGDKPLVATLMAEGTLAEMLEYFKEEPKAEEDATTA